MRMHLFIGSGLASFLLVSAMLNIFLRRGVDLPYTHDELLGSVFLCCALVVAEAIDTHGKAAAK